MQCEKKQDQAMHAMSAFKPSVQKIATLLTGVITQTRYEKPSSKLLPSCS